MDRARFQDMPRLFAPTPAPALHRRHGLLQGPGSHRSPLLPWDLRRGPAFPADGAIAESLVEKELFGHAREAFTDAGAAGARLVRLAHPGTLFLDEVDALPARGQVALPRSLSQSGKPPRRPRTRARDPPRPGVDLALHRPAPRERGRSRRNCSSPRARQGPRPR